MNGYLKKLQDNEGYKSLALNGKRFVPFEAVNWGFTLLPDVVPTGSRAWWLGKSHSDRDLIVPPGLRIFSDEFWTSEYMRGYSREAKGPISFYSARLAKDAAMGVEVVNFLVCTEWSIYYEWVWATKEMAEQEDIHELGDKGLRILRFEKLRAKAREAFLDYTTPKDFLNTLTSDC